MADYKDILKGTIGAVTNKVRSVTDGKSARDLYDEGVGIAGNLGKLAKLSLDLNGDNEEMKRCYVEIGKLFYEEGRGRASELYAPLFDRIDELKFDIAEKKQQMAALKGSSAPVQDVQSDIDAFSEVVDASDKDIPLV